MIRSATAEDMPVLITLGRAMHAESRFRGIAFSEEKLRRTLVAVMGGAGCVLVAERDGEVIGGFAGAVTEYYFSTERYVVDLALFVEPSRRGGVVAAALVRAVIAWAVSRGVRRFEFGISTGVHPEQTAKLYEALGFSRQGALFTLEA